MIHAVWLAPSCRYSVTNSGGVTATAAVRIFIEALQSYTFNITFDSLLQDDSKVGAGEEISGCSAAGASWMMIGVRPG
jgi:hypothetical protein